MDRIRIFKHHDDHKKSGGHADEEYPQPSAADRPQRPGSGLKVVEGKSPEALRADSHSELVPPRENPSGHPGRSLRPPGQDSLAAKIGLMLFGVVFSLVLFEVAFRLFASESSHQLSSADAPAWRDRPDHFYVPENSIDNRDFRYAAAKTPGTFRIVVVGDSFTFGGKVQFDDTFPKRLERMLNLNTAQRKVEVLNWGVPGFSTRNEELLVRRAVRDFAADLVLLEITLNDPEFKPYRVTHSFQDNQGDVVLSHWVFNYWKSLGYVTRRIFNTITHEDYKDYYFELYENPKTWHNFTIGIRNVHKLAAAGEIPVLAVIFPLFSHPLDQRYPFKPLHEKIGNYLKEQSFPFIDLLPGYQDIPPERLQAIPGKDSHPNEIANRIAADTIYRGLVAGDYIPEDIRIKKLYAGARKLKNKIPQVGPEEDNSTNDPAEADDLAGNN